MRETVLAIVMAIVKDSSSSFAVAIVALCALAAVMIIGFYMWLCSAAQNRYRIRQIVIENETAWRKQQQDHQERMMTIALEHPKAIEANAVAVTDRRARKELK